MTTGVVSLHREKLLRTRGQKKLSKQAQFRADFAAHGSSLHVLQALLLRDWFHCSTAHTSPWCNSSDLGIFAKKRKAILTFAPLNPRTLQQLRTFCFHFSQSGILPHPGKWHLYHLLLEVYSYSTISFPAFLLLGENTDPNKSCCTHILMWHFRRRKKNADGVSQINQFHRKKNKRTEDYGDF